MENLTKEMDIVQKWARIHPGEEWGQVLNYKVLSLIVFTMILTLEW